MTDPNFDIRSRLGNYFRGSTHHFEEKPNGDLEFTLYIVVNGHNHRLDVHFPLSDPEADIPALIEQTKRQFRLDIAALWLLDYQDHSDFIMGRGRFVDVGAITLTMTDSENNNVLAILTEG